MCLRSAPPYLWVMRKGGNTVYPLDGEKCFFQPLFHFWTPGDGQGYHSKLANDAAIGHKAEMSEKFMPQPAASLSLWVTLPSHFEKYGKDTLTQQSSANHGRFSVIGSQTLLSGQGPLSLLSWFLDMVKIKPNSKPKHHTKQGEHVVELVNCLLS